MISSYSLFSFSLVKETCSWLSGMSAKIETSACFKGRKRATFLNQHLPSSLSFLLCSHTNISHSLCKGLAYLTVTEEQFHQFLGIFVPKNIKEFCDLWLLHLKITMCSLFSLANFFTSRMSFTLVWVYYSQFCCVLMEAHWLRKLFSDVVLKLVAMLRVVFLS